MISSPLLHAQGSQADWPQKPVRLISPFSAGSSVDIMARLISQPLSKLLGQAVVVENKVGAGGNLGVDAVAKAPADGYTLAIATTGPMAINPSLMAHVPYNPIKDFAPVVLLAAGPNVLVVNSSMPVNNLDDLIKTLKANPGRYSYGSSGVGSTNHRESFLPTKPTPRSFISHTKETKTL